MLQNIQYCNAFEKILDKTILIDLYCRYTVEAEIKTVYALYRESGGVESRVEMQTVKWTAEGMVKGA